MTWIDYWSAGPDWLPKVGDWVALRCTPAQPLAQVESVRKQHPGGATVAYVAYVAGDERHTMWIRSATPEELASSQLSTLEIL